MLNSSRDKNEGTYRKWEEGGGGGSPLSDPGSQLLLAERKGESSAREINGTKKKKKKKGRSSRGQEPHSEITMVGAPFRGMRLYNNRGTYS